MNLPEVNIDPEHPLIMTAAIAYAILFIVAIITGSALLIGAVLAPAALVLAWYNRHHLRARNQGYDLYTEYAIEVQAKEKAGFDRRFDPALRKVKDDCVALVNNADGCIAVESSINQREDWSLRRKHIGTITIVVASDSSVDRNALGNALETAVSDDDRVHEFRDIDITSKSTPTGDYRDVTEGDVRSDTYRRLGEELSAEEEEVESIKRSR